MVWEYNVPRPPYLYPTILANAGTMKNKGLGIRLSAIPVQNEEFSMGYNSQLFNEQQ